MKSLVVQGQTLPIPLVRAFLMREGVVESLVSTVFRLPGLAVRGDAVEEIRTPELTTRWTILDDYVLIEWKKHGHAGHFLKGFRNDQGLPDAESPENAFGECIVNTRQATGSHKDYIARGKTYYYTFFIPADDPRFFLAKLFITARHKPGFTTFSAHLSDYTDESRKLAELVEQAKLSKQLIDFTHSMKPDHERLIEGFQSAAKRHEAYTNARETAGAELSAKTEQIKNDKSLTDEERQRRMREAESIHHYFLELMQGALIDKK